MKLKRTITIEFGRVGRGGSRDSGNLNWCELCGAETRYIDQREAAQLAEIILSGEPRFAARAPTENVITSSVEAFFRYVPTFPTS